MMNFVDCIPTLGKKLALYEKGEVIERLGEDVIKSTVAGILRGENIRSLTENLTKRRISLSSAALLKTYVEAASKIPDFAEKYTEIILSNYKQKKLSKTEKCYLNWFAGLTGKQIQNVLRGNNSSELEKYLAETNNLLKTAETELEKEFGNLSGSISIGNQKIDVSWLEILEIFLAVGSQTLALRGSEKSIYGKMFEKLVLGSVLTILGFDFVQRNSTDKTDKIFWLSERGEKRESDATALIKAGKGIRFDIGFIGVGNTEISLDKVSRFERNMEYANKTYNMSTVIIVDRIGEDSRIVQMAKEIDGHIIQMSMSNWVIELSNILYEELHYKSSIFNKSEAEVFTLISEKLKDIDLKQFLENKTVAPI